MAEVILDNVPSRIKNLFNKGFVAFEHGTLEYAIDLMFQCVVAEPGFLQARKFLRAAEIQLFKQKKTSALTHKITFLKKLPLYIKTFMLLKRGKAMEALAEAEKLMRDDPLSVQFTRLFAEAAEAANLPEAAILTLEIARDYYPDNVSIMKLLGDSQRQSGNIKKARETFEKLAEMCPHDPTVIKALKDTLALDSLNRDGWEETQEKGGTYRELIKDTKEAILLEQEAKAVKSDKDADSLITDALAKIEAEPTNLNYYRSLARLYVQKKRYDDAIASLTRALEVARGDPEIDSTLSATRVQKFDHEIEQLREAGNTEAADAKEMEKIQFAFDDLQARVTRYPNDPKLRYDWGVMLFENEYVNEAIQQFQISQKSAKHRVSSLFYLGLCFKQKSQYDLAKEVLEKAMADISVMDATKKNICYELGEIWDLMGNHEKAVEYFKEIYRVDINYRDVTHKIDQEYGK
jgi:tetratricopeptide (TPR) repeat protein